MPWQKQIDSMIGEPVGISLKSGEGVSGVLCAALENTLYVLEYLYQAQFAMKHYPFDMVEDVNLFPTCPPSQSPSPILY